MYSPVIAVAIFAVLVSSLFGVSTQMSNPCTSSGCSHLCLLSSSDPRGFSCVCPKGYELDEDGITCRNNTTFLLVADNQGITFLNPRSDSTSELYITSTPAKILVEYDYSRKFIYLYDPTYRIFTRKPLEGDNPLDLFNTISSTVGGISLDWITNKMYWTDYELAVIMVLDLDANPLYAKTVIKTGSNTKPGDIAVDPSSSYIFWINGGDTPAIKRASMDGKGQRTLHNFRLRSPTGIALDHDQRKVYWTDKALSRIETSYFDGCGRKRIISLPGHGLEIHPEFITLEKHTIYFTDSSVNTVFATSIEARNKRKVVPIYVSPNSTRLITGIATVSPSVQRMGEKSS